MCQPARKRQKKKQLVSRMWSAVDLAAVALVWTMGRVSGISERVPSFSEDRQQTFVKIRQPASRMICAFLSQLTLGTSVKLATNFLCQERPPQIEQSPGSTTSHHWRAYQTHSTQSWSDSVVHSAPMRWTVVSASSGSQIRHGVCLANNLQAPK